MLTFQINGRVLGESYPTFIIAEMSANHQGDIKIAKKIIKNAKDSGADAVKIQTYNASSITLNCDKDDFKIDNNSPWAKFKTLYNLYDVAQTPFKWHDELFRYASALNINIFSTINHYLYKKKTNSL